MALDNVDTPYTPEWWMVQLSRRMLNPDRLRRLATLQAYLCGRPPLLHATESQRKGFYAFTRVARSNFARTVVRQPAQRMAIRAIRTAAANDDNGDDLAWSYFTGAGLDIAMTDIHSDMLGLGEAAARVAVLDGDRPMAYRCDPWHTVVAKDPTNPNDTLAAMELKWDDIARKTYAYLWLPGQQWVAACDKKLPPNAMSVPGTLPPDGQRWRIGEKYIPRLNFSAGSFTMLPERDDSDVEGPYSETYNEDVVPVVNWTNRDGVGEFEEHLDLLDRINHTVMTRVVTAAVQAWKQRALEQAETTEKDRLPANDPDTGEKIDWDEIFLPGPDALWKLPPGVKVWESGVVDLTPLLESGRDDIKILSSVTDTPLSAFLPDSQNQAAAGADATREGRVFKVEDRDRIAARSWRELVSLMFRFAPDTDRYDAQKNDRADVGKIVIDWMPAERYSLQEMSQADSQNTTLSTQMAGQKIWQLSPDENRINAAQRATEALLNPPQPPIPRAPGGNAS